ncbi:hypothetical protein GOBAR_AA40462 [Gossypium barbadense]|uniref:Uncharacterized protein n=1 Tax=Gossypium barbadense TaxID=3634 RepID=A0A2P5VN34_GOSBA|nr:hypothetical protein GOBAR_AA40462 [Gossypium barbadense]
MGQDWVLSPKGGVESSIPYDEVKAEFIESRHKQPIRKKEKGCNSLIKDVWGGLSGENMKMANKLRRLKGAIKEWNMKSDGNVDKKIKAIERKLSEWDDLGSSRKLNEVELEEVRRLDMELWDAIRIRE